jgi:hypothetical protein
VLLTYSGWLPEVRLDELRHDIEMILPPLVLSLYPLLESPEMFWVGNGANLVGMRDCLVRFFQFVPGEEVGNLGRRLRRGADL